LAAVGEKTIQGWDFIAENTKEKFPTATSKIKETWGVVSEKTKEGFAVAVTQVKSMTSKNQEDLLGDFSDQRVNFFFTVKINFIGR
jgi:hypothetical protein